MNTVIKNRKIFIIILLVLAVFAEAVYLNSRDDAYDENITPEDVLNVTVWESAIDKIGPNEAYTFFKQEVGELDFSIQHLAAHQFGEALFKKQGVDGITVCDSSFAFGCYHQFFLSAISQHGIPIIEELDSVCIEKYTLWGLGCQHGIGHGLMEYFGEEGLAQALEACASLQWQEPFLGCQDGVFMENNFPTFIGEDRASGGVREYNPGNPEFPCNTIKEKFQQACFFAQPNWLIQAGEYSLTEVADICINLTGKINQRACLKGLGNYVGERSGGDIAEAVASCNIAISNNEENNVFCRAGVYWSYWKMDQHNSYRSMAQDACAGLSEEGFVLCESEADITGKFFTNHE
ncbi:MAG: hypothetical protein WDZ40_01470 [Candidatus Spechtbacterales bacterium]